MKKPSAGLRPRDSNWLTIEDFESLCFNTAREFLTFSEEIPDYDTRDYALLKSALGQPRQTYDGKLLYPTFEKQATALFYSLIKNHPFRNGNKRIAVMALFGFLALNGKWIKIPPSTLIRVALIVSKSDPKDRDNVLELTEDILSDSIVPFPSVKKS